MSGENKENPHAKTELFITICVGIVILIIFHILSMREWGDNIANYSHDRLSAKESAKSLQAGPANTNLFFFDITDEDYLSWGEPVLTPRKKVAKLVEFAWRGGAKVIVLDILLNHPDCCDPTGDRALRNLFLRMQHIKNVHVVVPVVFDISGKIKPTFIDDLLDDPDNRTFHRGTPIANAAANDKKFRFWTPFRRQNDTTGNSVVVWSVPVVASAYFMGQEQNLSATAQQLNTKTNSHSISIGTRVVSFDIDEKGNPIPNDSQRIRFRLIPPTVPSFSSNLAYRRLTAGTILNNSIDPPDELRSSIAIIGASHQDARDSFKTPVGDLPGMYIMGNAVHTVISGIEPRNIPGWLTFIIEALAVIGSAVLINRSPTYLKVMLITSALFVVANYVSWLMYQRMNIFLNLAIPLALMGIYRSTSKLLIAIFTEWVSRSKEVGKK